MRRVSILIGALFLLTAVAVASTWAGRESGEAPPQAPSEQQILSDSAHEQPESDKRTVLVADEPTLGSDQETLTVGLEEGTMPPSTATDAVVMTDENCTPDARGVSYCLNEIQIDGGETLSVRHKHRMHEVPCLVPGEPIRLRSV